MRRGHGNVNGWFCISVLRFDGDRTMRTLYDVLGVAPEAGLEVIRAAHRAGVERVGGEAAGTSSAESRAAAEDELRLINRAWAILSNPLFRQAYDARCREGAPSAAADWVPEPTGDTVDAGVPAAQRSVFWDRLYYFCLGVAVAGGGAVIVSLMSGGED